LYIGGKAHVSGVDLAYYSVLYVLKRCEGATYINTVFMVYRGNVITICVIVCIGYLACGIGIIVVIAIAIAIIVVIAWLLALRRLLLRCFIGIFFGRLRVLGAYVGAYLVYYRIDGNREENGNY
jgi:hypothetical protein